MMFLSFLFARVDALIIEGQGVLQMNNAICFASKNVFQPTYEKQIPPYWQYPCSLSIDSADLYFLSHDCGTCMFYCACELISSVRPFFVFRKPLDSLFIDGSLNLKDTNSFIAIDSSVSCFIRDTTHCYLPSIIPVSEQVASGPAESCRRIDWSLPLIAVTSQKKYVLITMAITTAQSCDVEGPPPWNCSTYIKSVNLQWFLQTDGTPNFRGITGIAQEKSRFRGAEVSFNSSRAMRGDLFDILGRKVPASESMPKKAYGLSNPKLFISDKNNKVKILFMDK